MSDFTATLWMYILWVINGFLLIVYLAIQHVAAILLAVSTIMFVFHTPKEQRARVAGSSALAVVASMIALTPIPLFLLILSLAGWTGEWLEQYNKPAQRWNTVRALALYATAGLAYTAYHVFGWDQPLVSNPDLAQGASYINAIFGIAMYVIPLGFLVMLTQSIWAHPPAPGTPGDLIANIRTRGKG